MSITLTPTQSSYLARVAEGLADLPAEDRDEVIQDLEAHLAELDDAEIEATLGNAVDFVAEFRNSAGLDESALSTRFTMLRQTRDRLDDWAERLSSLVRWPSIRPVWVWARGWLLVVGWSMLINGEGFDRFPIPTIGGSSFTGLLMIIGLTALSLWLAKSDHGMRALGSVVLSGAAGVALVGTLATPVPQYQEVYEEPMYYDYMVSPDGNPITNIFAYDIDGEPLQVLLYDQDGRPLRSLPSYVYEEAEFNPTQESFDTGFGTIVTFERDQYGRVIPNLFPLQMSMYSEYGEPVPVPPPSLGFPSDDAGAGPGTASGVTTTTFPAR